MEPKKCILPINMHDFLQQMHFRTHDAIFQNFSLLGVIFDQIPPKTLELSHNSKVKKKIQTG